MLVALNALLESFHAFAMRARLYSAYFTAASASRIRVAAGVLICAAVVLGLTLRWALRDFISGDWTLYLQYWQRFLTEYGGLPALRYAFSNYTAPYTYVLAAATQFLGALPLPPLHQVKLVSVCFDLALAGLAYLIVAQFQPNVLVRALAFAAVFLAPTVLLNSAAWSQADAIFTAFVLASVLALCKKRYGIGMALYAIALSFKLQAIFMLPLFVFLAVERSMRWRTFLLLPAVYALANVPALLMGRPPGDMVSVYLAQVDRYDDLTLNAPSVFQWLSAEPRDVLHQLGYVMTAAYVLAVWVVARRSRHPVAERPLLVAVLLLAGVPFFLPRMHDRYFYAADVLSIAAAFAYATPRAWKAALAINAASLAAYVTYLWSNDAGVPKVSLGLAALFIAASLVWLMEMLAGERPAQQPSAWRTILSPWPSRNLNIRGPEWLWLGGAVLAVAAAAAIGGRGRAANDQAFMAATFERDGRQVQLHRAFALQCGDDLRVRLTWAGSTLRMAPEGETYNVFVHVYDPQQRRIVVADGYVNGAFPLNKIEFDMAEERLITLADGQRAASVRVGVYAVETLERFDAVKPGGAAWEGNEVIIPVAECGTTNPSSALQRTEG